MKDYRNLDNYKNSYSFLTIANLLLNELFSFKQQISKNENNQIYRSIIDEINKITSLIKYLMKLYRSYNKTRFFLSNYTFFLSDALESIENNKKNIDNIKDASLIYSDLKDIRNTLQFFFNESKQLSEKNKLYNTPEFYKSQIKELKNTIKSLSEELEDVNSRRAENENQSIKKQLQNITELKNKYEKELIKIQEKEDVKHKWDTDIRDSFNNLHSTLNSLRKERKRLDFIFIIFSVMLILVTLSIIGYVIYLSCFVPIQETFSFTQYSLKIIPITLLVAAIWVSIVQMNRSQRQLITLAHFKHDVKYIEGLLLSLITLSPNINESAETITKAIEKLIEKNLQNKDINTLNEACIKNLETKDFIPIDIVKELIRNIKK